MRETIKKLGKVKLLALGLLLLTALSGSVATYIVRQQTIYNSRAQTGDSTINIDINANRHPISEDIYGITFWYNDKATAELAIAKEIRLPLNRSGGNAT